MSRNPFILVIDRSQWRCGGYKANIPTRGRGSTRLLNEEGYMCCLGFRCFAHNDTLDLRNAGLPYQVKGAPRLLRTRTGYNTQFADVAMKINDDAGLTDKQREAQLAALAATKGEQWIFVGEYDERVDAPTETTDVSTTPTHSGHA